MDGIIILDGATGTELLKHGYKGKDQPQWILEHKDIFLGLQRDYLAAGTQVLYTPTFVCSRSQLALCGKEDMTKEYNEMLCGITKSTGAKFYGDLGPSGLLSGRLGKATKEEIFNVYKEQASILEGCGVYGFIAETMGTKEDALLSVKAVKEVSNKPVILSLSCDKRGRIMSGDDILSILKEAEKLGISAFGLNCSTGPEDMLPQIKRIHENTDLPLLAKPNAGLPIIRGGKTVYDCPPEKFASFVPAFLENGVKYMGGCCGTTALHIKKMAEEIAKY